MQGDPNILQQLNLCLKDQLTVINQLFLHARMARNWGFARLDEAEYRRSIKAMKAADHIIERVLFLDGLPNLQDLGKLMIGETVAEIIDCDLTVATAIRAQLQTAIGQCEVARDYVSRDLLEELLEETEAAIDWLETQQTLLADLGTENYLQTQVGG